jgi:hypothetical protein
MTSQVKTKGKKVLSGNFDAFLRSPVRKARNDPLVASIYTRVDAILAVEVHTYMAAAKDRYVEDLIRYMTRGGKTAVLQQVLHPNAIFLPQVPPQALMDMTCATAVGSLSAVKNFFV